MLNSLSLLNNLLLVKFVLLLLNLDCIFLFSMVLSMEEELHELLDI